MVRSETHDYRPIPVGEQCEVLSLVGDIAEGEDGPTPHLHAVLGTSGGRVSGIWLVIIGWFIIAVATAEGGQAKLRELLSGIPVSDAMTPDPETVPGTTTVSEFLTDPRYRYRHSAFPVVDDGNVVGLVTLKGADAVPEAERASTTVAQAMVPVHDLPTPHPDDPLTRLVPELQAGSAHRALVLEGNRLAGIVTSSDISRVTSWLSSSSAWRSRTL